MMIPAVKLHESPLPTALLAKQPAVVEAVSKITTASMQAGVPLTTEQVKAVKDLIEAQRQAQETGGDESQDEDALRFIRGIKPSELLDEMGAKPKRTSNKIKKGIFGPLVWFESEMLRKIWNAKRRLVRRLINGLLLSSPCVKNLTSHQSTS
jgi:hypothetical protein